jgi:hypothetical protein
VITSELLRAAPKGENFDGIGRLGEGWITNRAWAAKADGTMKARWQPWLTREQAEAWRGLWLSKKQYAAKEIRRGLNPYPTGGDRIDVRIYSARGGRCVVFERMARLLDGYSVVRLGTAKLDPLGGIDETGELVVICMPADIDPSTIKAAP